MTTHHQYIIANHAIYIYHDLKKYDNSNLLIFNELIQLLDYYSYETYLAHRIYDIVTDDVNNGKKLHKLITILNLV